MAKKRNLFMLEKLKAEVCQANLDLVRKGLVIETWGNASGVDRERGLMVIKPSGVPYDGMKPKHMVVVSLTTGKVGRGKSQAKFGHATRIWCCIARFRTSAASFTRTAFTRRLGRRRNAACRAYGTTQADYWYGDVPCTRLLTPAEIKSDYEANTGRVIVETFKKSSTRCSIRRYWWRATGRSPGARTWRRRFTMRACWSLLRNSRAKPCGSIQS